MPSTTIHRSTLIASLDSRVFADHCAGKFLVDVSPSQFIGTGANNMLGAKVKITNPLGIVIRNHTTDYDILPPFNSTFEYAIPTIGGKPQKGKFVITVTIYESASVSYEVVKTVDVCHSDIQMSALMKAVCSEGKLFVHVDPAPALRGVLASSLDYDLELRFPTHSGVEPMDFFTGAFSVQMFEGVYLLKGSICAQYAFGDNVFVRINYKVEKEKNAKCSIDECCVYDKLVELQLRLKGDCTEEHRSETTAIIVDALSLLKTAQLAAECGEDASDWIDDLEKLLGCSCTCNCEVGTPVVPITVPVKDFIINGCNVGKVTQGNTTTYTIDNYEYIVDVKNDNEGILTIAAASTDECKKTQTLTFSIDKMYAVVKALANSNPDESKSWADIVNKSLHGLDPKCINIAPEVWITLSLADRFQAVMNRFCTSTQPNQSNCGATIGDFTYTKEGRDVLLSFELTNAAQGEIYIDGLLKGTVLGDVESFRAVGYADGLPHIYRLVAKCSDGSMGQAKEQQAQIWGCAAVGIPTVTSPQAIGVNCPFNLSTMAINPPEGITYEWRMENNPHSQVVANPQSVSDGVYWVFAKTSDNCYSTGVKVTVQCKVQTSCSAPQNVSVMINSLGGHIVRFGAAAYPPPNNSYTARRRLQSDPDVSGSYTVLPAPTFNAGLGRWETFDPSAVANTLYVYIVDSNCGTDKQSTQTTFANMTCPPVGQTTIAVDGNEAVFSFPVAPSNVTLYRVSLLNANTLLPIQAPKDIQAPFGDTIQTTWIGLPYDQQMNFRITAFIGDYEFLCPASHGLTIQSQAGVMSGVFKASGQSGASTICADGENITLYWTGSLSPGTVLYTDPALQNVLPSAYTHVVIPDAGVIRFVNFGVLGEGAGIC